MEVRKRMAFPIKVSTVTTVLIIVTVMIVGFIALGVFADLSPNVTPNYLREFSAGAAPLTIDVDQSDLININITQWNVTQGAWEYVYDANWTYYASSGTIIITPMINATSGNILVTAQYRVDMTSMWVTVTGVIGFVIIIIILFFIIRALPKSKN